MTTSDTHRAYLRGQAISDALIDAVCRTGKDGIEFHFTGPSGRRAVQVRLDSPRDPGTKYLGPKGEPSVMPVPPGYERLLADTSAPLLLVEGSKGVLAAASALAGSRNAVAVVGMLGCWGWSSEGKPTEDLDALPVTGRDVVVLLDADMGTNRQVWEAAKALGDQLGVVKGARSVRFATVPGRDKEGTDDVLARSPEADREAVLRRIIDSASDKLGRPPSGTSSRGDCFDSAGQLLARKAFDIAQATTPLAVTAERTVAAYGDGVYKAGPGSQFSNTIVRLLGDYYRPAHERTIEDVAVALLTAQGKVIPDRPDRLLINVRNGLLDPLTGRLHPHDPSFMTLFQLPLEWQADAECPRFEAWLEEQLPGGAAALLEILATALDPTWTPPKAAFLFGPSRSGKSTVLRILRAILGKDNVSSVTLHQLSHDQFAAANVYGKIANIAAELSSEEVRDLTNLKMMTGEDPVHANRKYGNQFSFVNQAFFAFSANEIPNVGEGSRAYLARMVPFHFANSFEGSEDPAVEAALMAELPGIFRLLVEALGRFVERGRQYLPADADTMDLFAAGSDKVREFLNERTVATVSPKGTNQADLFAAFKVWCEANGKQQLGRNKFYDRVNLAGVERFRVPGGEPKAGERRFAVRLIDPDREGPEGATVFPEKVSGDIHTVSTPSSEGSRSTSTKTVATVAKQGKRVTEPSRGMSPGSSPARPAASADLPTGHPTDSVTVLRDGNLSRSHRTPDGAIILWHQRADYVQPLVPSFHAGYVHSDAEDIPNDLPDDLCRRCLHGTTSGDRCEGCRTEGNEWWVPLEPPLVDRDEYDPAESRRVVEELLVAHLLADTDRPFEGEPNRAESGASNEGDIA